MIDLTTKPETISYFLEKWRSVLEMQDPALYASSPLPSFTYGDCYVYKDSENAEPLAYMWVTKDETAKVLCIEAIYVEFVWRRKGIGRLMLIFADNLRLIHGLHSIRTSVHVSNTAAQKLLESRRYRPTHLSYSKYSGG